MSDENHAETASTLDEAASSTPQATDTPAPSSNPTSATDANGNTVILNDQPQQTADISIAQTPSNTDIETIQK